MEAILGCMREHSMGMACDSFLKMINGGEEAMVSYVHSFGAFWLRLLALRLAIALSEPCGVIDGC